MGSPKLPPMWDADDSAAGSDLSVLRFSERPAGSVRDLLRLAMMAAVADRAILAKETRGGCVLLGGVSALDPSEETRPTTPCEERASAAILHHVAATRAPLHVQRPFLEERFGGDRYLLERRPASVFCVPLIHRGQVVASLYLERRTSAQAFTPHQQQLVSLLGAQAVITTAIVDYYIGEMKALEAKVNAQFIHNTLSVVAELVVSDSAKAEEALIMLSRLYRYVLQSPMDRIVSLSEEVDICRDYLALERHRLGDRMKADITVSGPVDLVHIPALILQPLVENAVRHGIARKVEGGHVHVEVTVTAETCRLRVSDDGPGWDERGERTGFGLRCVKERLALFYPGTHTFAITKGAGVSAEVTIPREGTGRRDAAGIDNASQNRTRNQSLKGQVMATAPSFTAITSDGKEFDTRIKFLTFIYRLYTDPQFQDRFEKGTEAAMDDYGLTKDQKIAVHHSAIDPTVVKNAVWWKKYADVLPAREGAARDKLPDPTSVADLDALKQYDDSPNPARMAPVVELLIAELCEPVKFEEAW